MRLPNFTYYSIEDSDDIFFKLNNFTHINVSRDTNVVLDYTPKTHEKSCTVLKINYKFIFAQLDIGDWFILKDSTFNRINNPSKLRKSSYTNYRLLSNYTEFTAFDTLRIIQIPQDIFYP